MPSHGATTTMGLCFSCHWHVHVKKKLDACRTFALHSQMKVQKIAPPKLHGSSAIGLPQTFHDLNGMTRGSISIGYRKWSPPRPLPARHHLSPPHLLLALCKLSTPHRTTARLTASCHSPPPPTVRGKAHGALVPALYLYPLDCFGKGEISNSKENKIWRS